MLNARKLKRGINVEYFIIENHYRIEIFYIVLDMQLQELNNNFNETNSQLVIRMVCFSPTNLFSYLTRQNWLNL